MRRVATLLMLVSLWCRAATAAGDIVLRTAVEPAEAWVGQRVVLQVDVLGTDGWAQISRFGGLDIPGAYLIRTDTQGTRLQETIDGVAYTGQRYEVSVYPQKAGAISVPPLPVEVTVKTWGAGTSQAVRQEKAPAVTINAKLPPGAEGVHGLVSTTQLSATQQWNPVIEALRVGDALQRTVTLQAEDVSGMVFVPLEFADLPGVGVYRAEPEVADSADRGSLSGRRSESVTYVFERPGSVRVPDINLTWWNVSAAKLEAITLPGRELEIAPGPAGTEGATGLSVSARFSVLGLWFSVAILSIVLALLLRFAKPMVQQWETFRRRRQESEMRYFKDALRSIRSKNARLALRDIMRWLDRINEGPAPAQLLALVRRYADRDAQVVVDQLLHEVAGDGHLADPAPLIRVLMAMRMRWRDAGRPKTAATFVLPGLNGQ